MLDGLHLSLFAMAAVAFLTADVLLLATIGRGRGPREPRSPDLAGRVGAELAWTLVPVVLFTALGLASSSGWARIRAPRHGPGEPDATMLARASATAAPARVPAPPGMKR